MTVRELMDVLKQLDPNTQVLVWNPDWDSKGPIDEIEVDQDGNVLII